VNGVLAASTRLLVLAATCGRVLAASTRANVKLRPLTHLKRDWINSGTIKGKSSESVQCLASRAFSIVHYTDSEDLPNQDIVYDFRAQLQGTGSRSEVLYD